MFATPALRTPLQAPAGAGETRVFQKMPPVSESMPNTLPPASAIKPMDLNPYPPLALATRSNEGSGICLLSPASCTFRSTPNPFMLCMFCREIELSVRTHASRCGVAFAVGQSWAFFPCARTERGVSTATVKRQNKLRHNADARKLESLFRIYLLL